MVSFGTKNVFYYFKRYSIDKSTLVSCEIKNFTVMNHGDRRID